MLEQEIKLQFSSVAAARDAVARAGGHLATSRRLIDDRIFDTTDTRLARPGTALRVRRDVGRAVLTVKGPVRPGPVKAREEVETPIDADRVEVMLSVLGFAPTFRSQKYREEYLVGTAKVTVDEAPFGVFVEVEGAPAEIERVTLLLGCTSADYRLESYTTLWRRWCADRGMAPCDMLFDDVAADR